MLKKDLSKILQQDLSNRSSISELRRNVFLHSSTSREKENIISEREKAINDLSGQLDYFKNQIVIRDRGQEEINQSFQSERNSLLDLINEKESTILQLSAELESLREKTSGLVSVHQELSKVQLQNSDYAAKIRELIEHISGLQTTHENYLKENSSLKIQNESLKNDIRLIKTGHAEEINKIQVELSIVTNNAAEKAKMLESRISELNIENTNLDEKNTELYSINTELQTSNFEAISELSLIRLKSEETVLVLKDEISTLESAAVAINSENRILTDKLTSLKLNSEETISVLKEEILGLESFALELKMENATVKHQLKDLKIKESESVAILKDEITELEKLSAESIENLQKRIHDEARKSESLHAELSRCHLKIKELESGIVSLTQNNNDLEVKVTTLNASLTTLQIERKELEKTSGLLHDSTIEVASLKNQLSDAENLRHILEKELLQSRENLSQANLKADSYDEVFSAHEKLKEDFFQLTNAANNLKGELKEQEEKNQELLIIVDELNLKIADTKLDELQQLADQLNTEKIKLEETVSDLKRELFKAEEDLSKFSDYEELESLKLQISAMEDETSSLIQQKENLENQVVELLSKLSEYSQKTENQIIRDIDLEKEPNSTTLAKALAGSLTDKKSVKLKINELLREIDRCIATLNAQS